jgi:DNA-binding beta-propeller fold protein YncE
VAVNSTGYVYVADAMNDRIQVFYPNGKYAFQWGSTGSGNGQFKFPMGIAINRATFPDKVYVSDTYNHRFQVFSAAGSYLGQFGSNGPENGNFTYPMGIEVQQTTSTVVYVADLYNHRVQKLLESGASPNNFVYSDQQGAYGVGNGYFKYPSDVTIDNNGAIYVTDAFNHRVQKFDSSLAFVAKWGVKGSDSGEFFYPRGIANDSSNNIYVVDSYNHRVQVFDSNGIFLEEWGHLGSAANEFRYPYGVEVSSGGVIYVADTQNNRIQSFEFVDSNDDWKNAFSLAEGNIEIGFTHKYAGLLASTNRSDWYKFYLLEAQSIRFRLDFYHVLSDFDFYLYDGSEAATRSSALSVPISWSNQSASDTETIGQIRIPDNGTYYLWITSKNASATNRFYNLTVQIRGVDDEYEENDEMITPTVLPTQDATYALFSLKNDPDFFGMPLLPDDFLNARIEFNNSLGNLDLYLYSITGALLNDSTSTGASFEEVSWHTIWGSFFILEIRGINSSFSWVGVEYNLIITITASDDQFEQNDAWGTPSSIAEGNWEDLILRDGDDDWYQVYLVQGDHMSIELIIGNPPEEHLQSHLLSVNQEEEPEEQMDADLSVFARTGLNTGNVDEDLELIARSETAKPAEFIEFTAPRTEIYLIWVEFFVGPNGNYTLLIDIAETDDIYEDNDNMEEATEFTVEGEVTYEDLLIRTLDDDWYKFYVEKGYGIYANISFSHLQGDLNLYLISENDTILAYSSSNDSDLEQFAPYEVKTTAWYYIVVKQSSGTHNSYSLSIDTGPYEELVAKYPDIPPPPTGEYGPPEEEGEDTIFGLPAIAVITVTAVGGGAVLGGGGFLGVRKIRRRRRGV